MIHLLVPQGVFLALQNSVHCTQTPHMPEFSITDLAKIIERDSKDATYKFALLRGTIELIQEHAHYKKVLGDQIVYPIGLLLIKWIEYYYPLISDESFIPQRHGDRPERSIAFRKEFQNLIAFYPDSKDAFTFLYDLKKGITRSDLAETTSKLVRKLRDTIVRQPMYYLGSAIGRGGEIYTYNKDAKRSGRYDSMESIVNDSGTFSVPVEFYHVLQVVGSFVTGTHSLIFRWAEFTANVANDSSISTSRIISLLNCEYSERDVERAKNFYSDMLHSDPIPCVWSGKVLRRDMQVDHLIPFAVMRNNDLWNLVPSHSTVNNSKRDKIPAEDFLQQESVKQRIVYYWEGLHSEYPQQFRSEVQLSLLGNTKFSDSGWMNESYSSLIDKCRHLVDDRGLDSWSYKK